MRFASLNCRLEIGVSLADVQTYLLNGTQKENVVEPGCWEYFKQVGLMKKMPLNFLSSPISAHLFFSASNYLLLKATVEKQIL